MQKVVEIPFQDRRYCIELCDDGMYLMTVFDTVQKDELTGLDLCLVDSFHRYYDEAWFALREQFDRVMREIFVSGHPQLYALRLKSL